MYFLFLVCISLPFIPLVSIAFICVSSTMDYSRTRNAMRCMAIPAQIQQTVHLFFCEGRQAGRQAGIPPSLDCLLFLVYYSHVLLSRETKETKR